MSEELLRQSIVALDSALQARLVNDVAAALDTELIAGTAIDGTKPLGLLNQPGLQTIVAGAAASFDLLYDMVGKLLTANWDATAARWLMTPGVFQVLRKTKANDGHYLMQPDVMEQGAFRLLGYPVSVTPRIPTTGVGAGTTKIVLWAPSMYAVARDIAPEVKVLTELYASTGQVGLRVQCRYDAGPLYPESVVIATGVTGA
ncbi:MAG: phage major capsid protein [Mycobacteriales bacterium]